MRIFGMLLFAILIGPIIGALARLVLPGKQDISFLKTWGLGSLGAFIGGIIALIFGWDSTGGIDWLQWILQVACAAALIGAAGRTSLVRR
ncbi:GlsB/YeaQ/YmgE family stress response membrane protein [Nocardia sp. NPDC127579]|uniref:GlsB/YeaQ/YmgE family stress response membrane protein n=1 Tax=Nocardia sp. NPDC127579 TaxID=3345402 RepID=UPI0036454ACA